MQNQHHNMSMFDKIGPSGGKNQQNSPPGPIEFHGKQMSAGAGGHHHLKPVGSKI